VFEGLFDTEQCSFPCFLAQNAVLAAETVPCRQTKG